MGAKSLRYGGAPGSREPEGLEWTNQGKETGKSERPEVRSHRACLLSQRNFGFYSERDKKYSRVLKHLCFERIPQPVWGQGTGRSRRTRKEPTGT